VRELRNVVERATILCRGEQVGLEHLPVSFSAAPPTEPRLGDPVPFEQIEAVHIRRLLAASKTMDEAAHALGVDAATLWRKRKKYGI
jgi:NtrC-family two-component system response regulator AlgB